MGCVGRSGKWIEMTAEDRAQHRALTGTTVIPWKWIRRRDAEIPFDGSGVILTGQG